MASEERYLDKVSTQKQLHKGHRERLRERFLREGLDNFEDHQVLELLLFQAIHASIQTRCTQTDTEIRQSFSRA
jgi:DNA repair protein RadC